MRRHGPHARLAASAAAALLLGLVVYLMDRGPGSGQWIPPLPVPVVAGLFGAAGGWLPSAAHAYAFSVLTVLALGPVPPRRAIEVCAAWALLDTMAEGLQHRAIASHAMRALDGLSAAEPLVRYIASGTFDVCDVAAATCGALLAAAGVLAVAPGDPQGDMHRG